ncbi:hypothetical protein [Roseibium aggregatum]|uniref:Uncharacterized protein n=1 Tax=Roseibium aggregatum TaxID=187304 RepID=A0A926S8U2_9HYPH|nr:hypothetical protein [Roseibium aggregatum]MBD1549322.1 hypothetical protein [Roseibium aggregatum]
MEWVDLSFKVEREYRKEIRQLAASLDVTQVDVIKEAIGLLANANVPMKMYPNLNQEAMESAEKRRKADDRGLCASELKVESLPRDDDPDPMEREPGKRGKKKRNRKKKS